jgi:dihydrolipoamide dehydrogenase
MREKYEIVAIGAGCGGLCATYRGRELGARCALIDKMEVGGECLIFGCIPTKSLSRSMETYRCVRNSSVMGIDVGGDTTMNFSKVMDRQKTIVHNIIQDVYKKFSDLEIDYYNGVGTIISPNTIRVNLNNPQRGQRREFILEARNIVVATGSSPKRISIPGAHLPGVLSNREILSLKKLPKSLVVLGCSYVGIEFGTIFAEMGSNVTMLGRKTFLKEADQSLARAVRQRMVEKQGINVDTGLTFLAIEETDENIYRVIYEKNGQERSALGEIVLMATGRDPYMDGLLEGNINLTMDGSGIAVNEFMETSVSGIYAVGDVLNGVMLAFSAYTEGEVAAENCLGKQIPMDYSVIPRCIFSYPELAGVGLTEEAARLTEGLEFGVAEFPFKSTPMALIMNQTEGLSRLVYEKGSGKILGGHILGPHASELIAELALAVHEGLTVRDLAYFLHFHPSLSENLQRAGKMGRLMAEKNLD